MSNELFQLLREDIGELKTEMQQTRGAVQDLRETVTRTGADHAARIKALEGKSEKTIMGLPVQLFLNVLLVVVILGMAGWRFFYEDLITGWMP